MVDFLVIDADGHVATTQEMWDQYMEKEYWDQRPQLVRTNSGRTKFMIQDTLYPGTAGFAPGLPGQREFGSLRSGGDDPKVRLEDMDSNGIDVCVCIPGGPGMNMVKDPGLAAAMSRARNTWLQDFCSEDPSRLRGVSFLPDQDMDTAITELKRIINEPWVAAIRLPGNVRGMGLDDPYFRPMFQMAVEHDLPVLIHAGAGGSDIQPLPAQERLKNFFETILVSHPFEQMLAMMKLIGGGVLEDFPTLRVAHFESGAGWVPYWVERMDEYFEHIGYLVPKMKRPASEYMNQGRLYFGIEAEDHSSVPMWRDWGWEDAVMFAWDYPHFDAILSGVVDVVMAHDDMTLPQKRKLLGENARRFYKFANLPAKKVASR